MHVVLATVGTRGDVQPFVALGAGLLARGHRVTVATHEDYEPFVTAHGPAFRPIGASFQRILESPAGRAWIAAGDSPLRALRLAREVFGAVLAPWFEGAYAAAADADAVLLHPFAPGALYAAEKRGVPRVVLAPSPAVPTAEIEPLFFPRAPRWTRRLVWRLMLRGLSDIYGPYLLQKRAELGLPPLASRNVFAEIIARTPVVGLYSPALVPTPGDWPAHVTTTGFCFVARSPDWKPPEALERFLAAGPRPVYVGFGSMTGVDPEALTHLTTEALGRAKLRAVIATGWGGVRGADLGEDAFVVESVPHDWLFPRVAGAVHHGGAGTTAASLRAGVPTLVVAFTADQPFWGRRVAAAGAGPMPLMRKGLRAEALAARLADLVGNAGYVAGARRMAEAIAAEDGVRSAVERIESIVVESPPSA